MLIFRRIILGLLTIVFATLLSTFVISRAVAITIGKPEVIKSSLQKSGFYKELPRQLYGKIQQSTNTKTGTIALNHPIVEEAFLQALSTDRLSKLVESSLDEVYRSLETGSEPRLSLDLAEIKQSFAAIIANKLNARLVGLPTCTSVPTSTDPFEITCLPPGFNIQAESDRIKNELLNSSEFLPQTVITLDTLRSGQLGTDKQAQETHQRIAYVYKWLMRLPLITSLMSLLVAILMIFVAPKRLRGIKQIFIIMITLGACLTIGSLLVQTLVLSELKSRLSSEAPSAIFDTTQAILQRTLHEILICAVAGIVIGLLALIGIAVFRRRKNTTIQQPPSSLSTN